MKILYNDDDNGARWLWKKCNKNNKKREIDKNERSRMGKEKVTDGTLPALMDKVTSNDCVRGWRVP